MAVRTWVANTIKILLLYIKVLVLAAVAQSVKHPGLRSLKRGATELMQVQFLVAVWELGKILAVLSLR